MTVQARTWISRFWAGILAVAVTGLTVFWLTAIGPSVDPMLRRGPLGGQDAAPSVSTGSDAVTGSLAPSLSVPDRPSSPGETQAREEVAASPHTIRILPLGHPVAAEAYPWLPSLGFRKLSEIYVHGAAWPYVPTLQELKAKFPDSDVSRMDVLVEGDGTAGIGLRVGAVERVTVGAAMQVRASVSDTEGRALAGVPVVLVPAGPVGSAVGPSRGTILAVTDDRGMVQFSDVRGEWGNGQASVHVAIPNSAQAVAAGSEVQATVNRPGRLRIVAGDAGTPPNSTLLLDGASQFAFGPLQMAFRSVVEHPVSLRGRLSITIRDEEGRSASRSVRPPRSLQQPALADLSELGMLGGFVARLKSNDAEPPCRGPVALSLWSSQGAWVTDLLKVDQSQAIEWTGVLVGAARWGAATLRVSCASGCCYRAASAEVKWHPGIVQVGELAYDARVDGLLSGRVVSGGRPVEGAKIRVSNAFAITHSDAVLGFAESGADGTFRVLNLPFGVDLDVHVRSAGHSHRAFLGLQLPMTPLTVELVPAADVLAALLPPNCETYSSLSIRLERVDGVRAPPNAGVLEPPNRVLEGRYLTFEDVEVGTWVLRVGSSSASIDWVSDPFAVSAGAPVDLGLVDLRGEAGCVRIRASDILSGSEIEEFWARTMDEGPQRLWIKAEEGELALLVSHEGSVVEIAAPGYRLERSIIHPGSVNAALSGLPHPHVTLRLDAQDPAFEGLTVRIELEPKFVGAPAPPFLRPVAVQDESQVELLSLGDGPYEVKWTLSESLPNHNAVTSLGQSLLTLTAGQQVYEVGRPDPALLPSHSFSEGVRR